MKSQTFSTATYADTSLLVSLYLEDSHSHIADQMLQTWMECFLTPLHRAEWFHAIAQHIFRGSLTETNAGELHSLFAHDTRTGPWREVAIPENAIDLCADLGRRYGPKLGVRTLDTLHVACAIELKATRFCTFDDRQAKLAKAQGLKVT
ncbi:MAG TPA: type II toxin-antitoxin system VapC family toxin [Candidatus Binatia bacterium]|jgi:predicted nucleic acid-binding protein|nr:type II toxin-antitoxin system VapC family toxin [Candidatus Binatia bacterium]